MKRITIKDLKVLVLAINEATGSPTEAYTRTKGKLRANVGNYHIERAYGGNKLVRMDNESGGTRNVLSTGFISKRELYMAIHAFYCGIIVK